MQATSPYGFAGTERFRVLRKLGRGGMGEVYEVEDCARQVRVALKTLPHISPRGIVFFKREFRFFADLLHPNLVSLYELFQEGDLWFFTMELIEGETIGRALRRQAGYFESEASLKPTSDSESKTAPSKSEDLLPTLASSDALPTMDTPAGPDLASSAEASSAEVKHEVACSPQSVCRALAQVAEGLQAIHESGKLHRDLKSSNILLAKDGRALILDFGLAAEVSESGSSDEQWVVGTPVYMSPEQAMAQSLTAATDWYAFGVVMYELLTGRMPVPGNAQECMKWKQFAVPISPRTHSPEVSPELAHLCLELLSIDPVKRPSGNQVIEELHRLSGENAVRAKRAVHLGSFDLLGRDPEIAALDQGLQQLSDKPVMLFVHGASGIGKSTLIQKWLERKENVLQLRGRCYEQESVPYKALDGVMDSLVNHLEQVPCELQYLDAGELGALARIFPVMHTVPGIPATSQDRVSDGDDERAQRRKAIRALRGLLNLVAARQPTVIPIDDLQWGDTDSVALLSDVLAGPHAPPVMLVFNYRREYLDRSECLQQLLSVPEKVGSARIDLPVEPFDVEQGMVLASQLLSRFGAGPNEAEAIARESEGNPLFIVQLALEAATPHEGGIAKLGDLDSLLQRRVGALPDDARQLLEVISLYGQPLAQADAFPAAGLRGRDPAVFNRLRSAFLVRSSGFGELDHLEPYHDRIREAVVGHLPSERKQCHHQSLAETLETSGRAEPETLASHFLGAGSKQKAGHYFTIATDRASAALAFDRAIAHCRQALELTEDANHARTLQHKLAENMVNAGRNVEGARVYEELAPQGSAAEALRLRRDAGFHYCCSGYVTDAMRVFEDVLSKVGLSMPKSATGTLASLMIRYLILELNGFEFRERPPASRDPRLLDRFDAAWAVAAGLSMVNIAQSLNFSALCLRLAMRTGDPQRLIQAMLIGNSLFGFRDSARHHADELLAISRRIVARSPDPLLEAYIEFSEGTLAYQDCKWARSCEHLAMAEQILTTRCRGVHWELSTLRTLRLYSLWTLGEFEELRQRSEWLLQDSEERGDVYTFTNVASFCQPMALLAKNQPEAASQSVAQALSRWTHQGFQFQHVMATMALGYIAMYEGKAAPFLSFLNEQWKLFEKNGFHRIVTLRATWRMMRIHAALATAEDEAYDPASRAAAKLLAGKTGQLMLREEKTWAKAYGDSSQAALAMAKGDVLGAIESLRQTENKFRSTDTFGYAYSAQWRMGLLMGGERGSELVADADRWFRSKGVVDVARMVNLHIGPIVRPKEVK